MVKVFHFSIVVFSAIVVALAVTWMIGDVRVWLASLDAGPALTPGWFATRALVWSALLVVVPGVVFGSLHLAGVPGRRAADVAILGGGFALAALFFTWVWRTGPLVFSALLGDTPIESSWVVTFAVQCAMFSGAAVVFACIVHAHTRARRFVRPVR